MPMIKTFADKRTAALFDGYVVHSLPRSIQAIAYRKLQMIDAAESIVDLHAPPGNRLEALRGDRAGQWSVRVNARWRICFHFVEGAAFNVEIVDYH
ncbi:proteic killer suppression protein [Trinickia caryophylli]|uniref:Proteic killer suppression protein n=2 Tax=Trinickia caryophylli TaxID=28094 RepID=A0A1X7CLC0_TRICW|nr:proteic killer suppression protein [Trinickia caryophylli]